MGCAAAKPKPVTSAELEAPPMPLRRRDPPQVIAAEQNQPEEIVTKTPVVEEKPPVEETKIEPVPKVLIKEEPDKGASEVPEPTLPTLRNAENLGFVYTASSG